MSNEIETVKILVCPSDTRALAPDWTRLRDTNISYFVGSDTREDKVGMLLVGDWNISGGTKNRSCPVAGVTNLTMDRDREIDLELFPTPPLNPAGASATARCVDGSWSWAATRGDACTANGGVVYGVCPGPMCDGR